MSRSTKAVLTNLRNDSLLVLPRFDLESCIKVAITVRGDVLKLTLVVDNDTTLHGAYTDTVAFILSVLIKCSICSYHQLVTRTPHEWLKKSIHDKRSHFDLTFAAQVII